MKRYCIEFGPFKAVNSLSLLLLSNCLTSV